MGRLMHLDNLDVQGLPQGPLAECPACAGAPDMHVCIDFCFSAVTRSRGPASHMRGVDPDNKRVFVDVDTYVAELEQGDAAKQAATDADHACSDFNAARALSRTSDGAIVAVVPRGATFC